jgi:carbamoyl-phosphate synthase large subunit
MRILTGFLPASDGTAVIVGGVMEHIEAAGVHSGDSAMVLPPHSLPAPMVEDIKDRTRRIALELGVVGLINIQFAVKDAIIYVLEINPRASRTVPFVSKATGVPLAKLASQTMVGRSLAELGVTSDPQCRYCAVKESVLPFSRFPGVDPVLGPEMKSTGEVMGIDKTFPVAYAKSQVEAGQPLPQGGTVFISVRDADKPRIVAIARELAEAGMQIAATTGTAGALAAAGIEARTYRKLATGRRPNVLDHIKSGEVHLIINTPSGPVPRRDEVQIRAAAITYGVPLITTVAAASAAAGAIGSLAGATFAVHSLQEIHAG